MRSPARLALAALTVLFLALGLAQAGRDVPTVDEGPDLVAALWTVADRDLRLNPEHGALFHAASGVLPVLLADPLMPEGDAYRDGRWFDHTDAVIAANDAAGTLDDVLFWFRVVPLLLGAGTAWVLFQLGRRLGGELGGLLAGGLWLTTPYVLGLSHLGSLDVAFGAVVAGLVLAIARDRESPTLSRAAAVAVTLGAGLAVRHSAVVLVPVAVGFVVLHRRDDRRQLARAALAVLVVPVLVVFAVYRGVDLEPVSGAPAARFDAMIATASADGLLERLVLAVPMPVEWRAGFAYLSITSEPRPAYLLGDTREGNAAWFFPASALVKLPLTASLAMAAGAVALVRRHRRDAVTAPLLACAVVLALFTALQPLALGLRLAIPVIALLAVPTGALGGLARRPVAVAALAVAGTVQVTATLAAHPTSLAWTPPPFSDGYRFVSDSSIDYGQALGAVRRAHEADPFVAVSLVTSRGLTRPAGAGAVAGAEAEDLVGRIAVGATSLLVIDADELSWLRAYCPVQVLDGAVLVYEFAEPPDRAPASGMPEPPCAGGPSTRRR